MQITTKVTMKNIAVEEQFWQGRLNTLEREVVRAIEGVLDRHTDSKHFELAYDILVTYPVETPEIPVGAALERIADECVDAAGTDRKITAIKMYRELARESEGEYVSLADARNAIYAAIERREKTYHQS
jgi:hypothetical protein